MQNIDIRIFLQQTSICLKIIGMSATVETSAVGIEGLQFSSTGNRNVNTSSKIAANALPGNQKLCGLKIIPK